MMKQNHEVSNVPEGYKQTVLGIIPEDWEMDVLGNLTTNIVDGTHHTPTYMNYGIPFLRVTDLQGVLNFERFKFVSKEEHLDLIRRCHPKKGDLLLSKNGTIGLSKVVDWDWDFSIFVSLALIQIRKNLINVYYLEQYFKSSFLDVQLSQRAKQGTVTNLHLEEIRELSIPLPSLKEQTAIANALSDVDALIAELEKLIAKKEAIKTGAMQQLLTGRTRLPQFAKREDGTPKGYKTSELGEIPEDWEVKELTEVIIFKNGVAHEDSVNDFGKYVLVNSRFISTEGAVVKFTDQCRQAVYKDDVLMVMSDVPNGRAIAKCYFVEKDDCYTLNQRICALTAHSAIPLFLYYILNRNEYYLSFDDGAKQTNLRREDVLKCPIVMPSLQEQLCITEILSDMDSELEALEKRLNKTKALKQGMMQELLTGRTRLV